MAKYLLLALCLLSVIHIQATSIDIIDGKIKITVGTTAGCSDTVRFMPELVGVYARYRDFLEIVFVPWGRTAYNEDGSMECQFGANDCWANRVHRCALDMLKDNQDAQVFYMNCEFSTPYPAAFLQGSYLCAQAVGLSFVEMDYCVTTAGRSLDDAAQAAAEEPMSIINFVPSIHFNEVIDRGIHDQARQRLTSMVCFALAEDPNTGVTNCQI